LNQIGLIIKGDTSYIMGVSSGLLSLQNDKFMERQIEFYKKVQEEKDMIDVTVACDGAEVKAHRLVISASSPFFRKIIKTSNHPSPYIYLSGLHPDDLESIMSFVYTGETKVEANNIQRFMNSASELQISGLCEDVETDLAEGESPTVDTARTKKTVKGGADQTDASPNVTKMCENVQRSPTQVQKSPKKDLRGTLEEAGDVQVKKEVEDEMETETTNNNANRSLANSKEKKKKDSRVPMSDNNEEALEKELSKRMENVIDASGQKLTRCTVCGKTFKQKSKAKFHIETHIEGFSHTCNICGATAKTKKSLAVHVYNYHSKYDKHQE